MDLIISREPHDDFTWMVAANSRGLGLFDCGCGEIVLSRTIVSQGPKNAPKTVLLMSFTHHNSLPCQMAFDYHTFNSLSWEQYCERMEIEDEGGE